MGIAPAGTRPIETFKLPAEYIRRLDLLTRLDKVHSAYALAQSEIVSSIGVPICIQGCGACCHNSVTSFGIEAVHAVGYLLGHPKLLRPALDAMREWLTRTDEYTYGRDALSRLSPRARDEEWGRILHEVCPFLMPDKSCMIHEARPLVCRAYGVTHMPHRGCPRPIGIGEDDGSRAWWNSAHPKIPIRPMVESMLSDAGDLQLRREGFFVTMMFEELAAGELAGMIDDGRVPILKLAMGVGDALGLLWQDQLERDWQAEADAAIATQVRLKSGDDGNLHMVLGAK